MYSSYASYISLEASVPKYDDNGPQSFVQVKQIERSLSKERDNDQYAIHHEDHSYEIASEEPREFVYHKYQKDTPPPLLLERQGSDHKPAVSSISFSIVNQADLPLAFPSCPGCSPLERLLLPTSKTYLLYPDKCDFNKLILDSIE